MGRVRGCEEGLGSSPSSPMLIILVTYVLGYAAAWSFWWGLSAARPAAAEAGVVLLFGGAGVGLGLEMIASCGAGRRCC